MSPEDLHKNVSYQDIVKCEMAFEIKNRVEEVLSGNP